MNVLGQQRFHKGCPAAADRAAHPGTLVLGTSSLSYLGNCYFYLWVNEDLGSGARLRDGVSVFINIFIIKRCFLGNMKRSYP